MIGDMGRAGAIIGAVGLAFIILNSIIGFIMIEAMSHSALQLFEFQFGVRILFDIFDSVRIVAVIIAIVYSLITLNFTIKYLITGRYRLAAGILNIVTFSVICVVAGILIILSRTEDKDIICP